MSTTPRLISTTVSSQQTTHLCYFEVDSKIHTIRVVVNDNRITETIRTGDHSHLSLSENQWLTIRSEIAEKLLS